MVTVSSSLMETKKVKAKCKGTEICFKWKKKKITEKTTNRTEITNLSDEEFEVLV